MTTSIDRPSMFDNVRPPDGLIDVDFRVIRSATIRYIGDTHTDHVKRLDPVTWGVWALFDSDGVAFIPWGSIGAIDVHQIMVPKAHTP